MIVIFSGPSGAGKSTIINALIHKHEDCELMPTMTTRNPRPGESQGNPYYFVTRDEFEKLIDEDQFYEYQPVHDNFYGTNKKVLNDKLASGKILLKDIDVLGTAELKTVLKDVTPIKCIYVKADEEALRERLILRGETEEMIDLRLSRMKKEEEYEANYDIVIVNRDIDESVAIAEKLIFGE